MSLRFVMVTGILGIAPCAILAQPTTQTPAKTLFTYQLELRARYERRDSVDFDSRGGNDPQDQAGRLRLGFRLAHAEGWTAFLQPQFAVQNRSKPALSKFTMHDLDMHQGYVESKGGNWNWRIGRQELVYGDQRLIGNADWLNVGRSFDGLKFTYKEKNASIDFLAAKLGLFESKTTDPTIAGIYSVVAPCKTGTVDTYLLYKSARLSPTTNQKVYTFGARPKFKLGKGFDTTIETALQGGNSAGRNIEAWAFAANVGYTIPGSHGVRLAIEHDFASGGPTSGSGPIHTFDQLFPTNHLHYGIADFVGWRNMRDLRMSAQAKPTSKVRISVDGHFFSLADARDGWYADNGKPVTGVGGIVLKDASGGSGKDIGSEIDVTVAYTLNKASVLSVGYSRFMPGSFVKHTNGGFASSSDWFYVQTQFGL